MTHQFVDSDDCVDCDKCHYVLVENVKLDGGGGYKVTTPCLLSREDHQGLQ